jgi:hypothetical protein
MDKRMALHVRQLSEAFLAYLTLEGLKDTTTNDYDRVRSQDIISTNLLARVCFDMLPEAAVPGKHLGTLFAPELLDHLILVRLQAKINDPSFSFPSK